MDKGILSIIGNTPLVELTRVFRDAPVRVYAKLEGFNPGGSTKDRPAFAIIRNAVEAGHVGPGSVVIESSSGNMGIGLAQACSFYGLRFICVVDPKTTALNLSLLRAYGAEVDVVTEPDPVTGEFLQARINRVQTLLRSVAGGFWPNQYSNLYNPLAHHQTMSEIVGQLGGEVDYLFCATSTCGTMRGCAEFVRQRDLPTKIYAVDAVGSVIWGGKKTRRLIPGHGAAVRPELYQPGLAHECVHVTDLDCIVGCRRLVRQEAILAGGSSGAVLVALERVMHGLPPGSVCVLIFPDRGERYLDTIYSDAWVRNYFGEVAHLWQESLEVQPCVTATF